jgi:hypothetical protein
MPVVVAEAEAEVVVVAAADADHLSLQSSCRNAAGPLPAAFTHRDGSARTMSVADQPRCFFFAFFPGPVFVGQGVTAFDCPA